jgi:RNA-directed DNA polymerase
VSPESPALMRGGVRQTRMKVEQIMARLGLTINEEKTRSVDAREASFEFLGFDFRRKRNPKTGKLIALIQPSRKSEQHFRDNVRELTARAGLRWSGSIGM